MTTIKNLSEKKYFTSNALLMYKAAELLGYKITPLLVEGEASINKFGFSVTKNKKTCYISNGSHFPGVASWQLALMSDKILTTALLNNLSYPQIKSLAVHHKRQSLTSTKKLVSVFDLPVIIKPSHGSDGSGIHLCRTSKHVNQIITEYYAEKRNFLVQPFVVRPEYRLLFIDGKIEFIHRKSFPQIIGDGVSTIEKLLSGKKYCSEEVLAYECKKLGYKLSSILPLGESIITHITKKSDSGYFINDNFPKPVSEWAKRLAQAIGVETVGIDVFIDGDLRKPTNITIIELNSKPSLHYIDQYYKESGASLRIAKTVLKNYFETK